MVLASGIEENKMLTTGSSQYLHPDYLQPLPTTLDAKKSPLALLAQTCSNIGKDITTNSKPVIPPLEKKDGRISAEKEEKKEEKREEKTTPRREPSRTPSKLAPPIKEKPPTPRQESPRTSEASPPPSESRDRKSPSSRKATPISLPSTTSSSSTTSGHLPLDPHLYYSHAAALDPLYASALAAHASLGLKPGELSPHLPPLAPYVAYAHVKTANGATTVIPVCRDPYCTNCQLSLRGASLPCPAGCTQCNHDKPPAAHHPLPFLPLGLPSGLGSLYPSYIPSAHGLPNVCNWVSGSEHCGKRFTTSEELLRHLRTHTNSTDASSLPLSSYALPSSLSPYHGHLAPSLSPNSLHRSYPTSLSPISNALASNRFHPYKSSLSSLSASSLPPNVPSLPFPGAYYSPYSLYSSRLGAAAAP